MPITNAPTRNAAAAPVVVATDAIENGRPCSAAAMAPPTAPRMIEAEDVVDHGGAENDPGFRTAGRAEVLQYARGDADAGRTESGAKERVHVGTRIGQQPHPHTPPEREGDDDPEDRDEQRRDPHFQHLCDGGLDADFEQQDQRTNAREHLDRLVRRDRLEWRVSAERQIAEDDPGDQLSKHGGLLRACREFAAELAGQQQHRQGGHDSRYRVRVHQRQGMRSRTVVPKWSAFVLLSSWTAPP